MSNSSAIRDCATRQAAFKDLKAALPTVPRLDLPAFFARASSLGAAMPLEVRQALEDFSVNGNDEGYLLLTGLPIDEDALPATPTSVAPVDRPLLDMEAWIALFAVFLGKPTGYQGNRGGSVFQDVHPIPGALSMTANGYTDELRYHTEMAYHRHQPDYLVIGCSRADHDRVATTLIASVRKAVRLLSEEHRAVLRRVPLPWHVDLAFRGEADPDPMTRLLLLVDGDDVLRYDRALIDPAEAGEAADALRAFSAAMDAVAVGLRLRPGEVVILDNRRTSHSRIAYTPRFDGKDRWLNRLFVRSPADAALLPYGEVVPFELRRADHPVSHARAAETATA